MKEISEYRSSFKSENVKLQSMDQIKEQIKEEPKPLHQETH